MLVIGIAVLCVHVLLLMDAGTGEGRTITVDDDGEAEFTNIQDAINASEDGDTVRVWDGVYHERVFVIREIQMMGNGSGSSIIEYDENTDIIMIS